METEAEWKFINREIQKLTISGRLSGINEWHIGLKKQAGTWKWVNGRPLTIAKWQPNRPDGDGDVAVISKDHPPGSQGLFNDLHYINHRAFICELTFGKRIRVYIQKSLYEECDYRAA